MPQIDLTEREAEVLADILETYLSDLRTELVATEKREWRTEMKEREGIGKALLLRISGK